MKDASHLREYQFKPGQSGNPSGRPKGTLKDYAREKFIAMSTVEKDAYLASIPKLERWKMVEGSPDSKTDVTSGGKPLAINLVSFDDYNTQQLPSREN